MASLGWILPLLVVTSVLAGCSGGDDDPDPITNDPGSPTPSPTGTPTTKPSPTVSPSPGATPSPSPSPNPLPGGNEAPVASLTSSLEGGALPLLVNFTVKGSDPDDDPLTWSMDFGDDSEAVTGAEVPTSLNHTFERVGSFNVTLTMTDGELSDVKVLVINVTGAASGPVTLQGSYAAGGPGQACSPIGALFTLGGDEGATHSQVAITPDLHGRPFTLTVDSAAPTAGVTISWVAGTGIYGAETNFPSPEPSISGTVDSGADSAIVSSCGGVDVAWTMVIS